MRGGTPGWRFSRWRKPRHFALVTATSRDAQSLAPRIVGAQRVCRTDGRALPHPVQGGTKQSVGDQVARVLEREYSRIGKTLNSFPAETLTVILYTNREFHDITRSPAWATGNYDGRIRIAVGGELRAHELDRVVTHELAHAVIASAAPRPLPTWLNEGLATYLKSDDRGWAREVLRNASTIVSLETLARGFNGLDEQGALVAYAESAVAAESSARSWVRTLVRSCSSSATDAQSTRRSSSSRSNQTRFMPSGAGESGCSRPISVGHRARTEFTFVLRADTPDAHSQSWPARLLKSARRRESSPSMRENRECFIALPKSICCVSRRGARAVTP